MADEVIFDDGSAPSKARTHVLIVGVGHYPYFKSGGPKGDRNCVLGQLTPPPVSARALANWFIETYSYPNAPLGTVSLLVSERRASPFRFERVPNEGLPRASYQNFSNAAKRWTARARNQKSRLIFMFCGHGFGYGTEVSSLLLDDFDFRETDCWDNALDLGQFVAGLEEVPATEQLFFIDACRRPHPASLRPGASIGRSPIQVRDANPRSGLERRNAPVLFSTGDGQPARGRTGGLSVFTEAFLHAVRGMGARDEAGPWTVNSYSLLEAMDHVSTRLTASSFPQPQQPQGTQVRKFELHYLPSDPISPVYVKRGNGEACGPALLRYQKGGSDSCTKRCSNNDTEVELQLALGKYRFHLVDGAGRRLGVGEGESRPVYRIVVLR